MNLEEELNKLLLLDGAHGPLLWKSIDEGKWTGFYDLVFKMNLLIRDAPLVECLTSPSAYVRECKLKWEALNE